MENTKVIISRENRDLESWCRKYHTYRHEAPKTDEEIRQHNEEVGRRQVQRLHDLLNQM